ncbi:MAG: KilA-N domain-containing protein [Thiomargarita sp.]|nr:KilA-N domain-containing protein [Thiomargarita sp.]
MKTEVILSRLFAGGAIRQLSKSGFLNATDITGIYNAMRCGGGRAPKEMNDFFKSISTEDYMVALCNELNLNGNSKQEDSPVYSNGMDKGIEKVWTPADLKSIKRGKNNMGTWLHPYLFTKYAMWLSPEFEVKIIIWITDQLLELRNDSGDEYKALCKALKTSELAIESWDYAKVAKCIAKRVLGSAQAGCWDGVDAKQLELRRDIETYVARVISGGFITSLSQVIEMIKTYK